MTDYTKYNYYKPDGAGRDLYIIYNNGGEFRSGYKLPEDKVTFPKINNNQHAPSLRKENPPVSYRSNGTGRDSYIM
jgi:hypothetical protein